MYKKQFIRISVFILVGVLTALIIVALKPDILRNNPLFGGKEDVEVFIKAPVRFLAYANGIFYNPEDKRNAGYYDAYYDSEGRSITPVVETVSYEVKARHMAYGYNSGELAFQVEVVKEIEVDFIKHKDSVVVKAMAAIREGETYEYGIPTVSTLILDERVAFIQIDDNIYRLDMKTRELSEFINGEYPGILFRTYDFVDDEGESWLQKFQTAWAILRGISDNGRYMVFGRTYDVGEKGELWGVNGDGFFVKDILTGEERYIDSDVGIIKWDGDALYYEKVKTPLDPANGIEYSTFSIIRYDCAKGIGTAVNEYTGSSIRMSQHYGAAMGWVVEAGEKALKVEDKVTGKTFEIILPKKILLDEVRWITVSPDGRNICFGGYVVIDGKIISPSYLLKNYREWADGKSELIMIDVGSTIGEINFIGGEMLRIHAAAGTYLTNIRKLG